MRLWTWQFECSSPLVAKVDPRKKGTYYETNPKFQPHMERLWKALKSDQVLWCFTDESEAQVTWRAREKWTLDVPDGSDSLLRIIDPSVWERILGQNTFANDIKTRQQLMSLFISQGKLPASTALDNFEATYESTSAPNGDWWSVLFLKSIQDECWTQTWLNNHFGTDEILAIKPQVLLKRPVDSKWIVPE